jgi:hypothetical protein
MIHCPLCSSLYISFAYLNIKGFRFLNCNCCKFIFKDNIKSVDLDDIISPSQINKINDSSNLINSICSGISKDPLNFSYLKFTFLNFEDLYKLDFSYYFFNKQNIVKYLHDRGFTNFFFTEVNNESYVKFLKRSEVDLKISFVMPVFNEIANCKNSIDNILDLKINGLNFELIIIESNSTDGTRDVVRRYSSNPLVKILYQDSPKGKGNAVREGINYATGDFIAIHDADDEYSVRDYLFLLSPLISGSTSFVLGNRHHGSWMTIRSFENQPIRAFILNLGHIFFTKLINLVIKGNLKDPFTMFKIIRRDILSHLELESNRFDFDHEIVIKLCRLGFYPVEIPVSYRSRSFSEGKKVNFLMDPLSWIYAIFKFGILKR